MRTARARIRVLGLLVLLLSIAAPAFARVTIHPDLEAELRAKGAYDEIVAQLRAARERGAFDDGFTGEGPRFKAEPGKMTTWNAIIILVDFSDNPANGLYGDVDFNDMLLSQGTYPTGSMTEHYLESSYGDFLITGDVVGWYRMPNPYTYYCNQDGVPGTGDDNGFGSYPNNARKLYEDAVTAADPDVDFNDYKNGNPRVEGVFVVHAGPGAETTGSASHVWSHRSSGVFPTDDRVDCGSYTHQPELQGGGMSTMGVFAHEFGHSLGLPDLYDTDGTSQGIGRWCMMAGGSWNGGGTRPAHFSAWCQRFLGWVSPTNITVDTPGLVISPSTLGPAQFRIQADNHAAQEFLLLENRKKTGFDASLPGEGLLVWHIDGSQGSNAQESCGSGANHPRVRLIQADGLCEMEANVSSGDTDDPFPGTTNNTKLGALTNPDSRAYNGKKTGIVLDNIAKVGDDIVLDVALIEILQLNVPLEYPTLDAAISVGGDGDQIRLQAGYTEAGDWFVDEGVNISGGWDASYTVQDDQNPSIIEGTGALQPIFDVAGSGQALTLDNVVVRNGGGLRVFQPSDAWKGGALAMSGGSFLATRTRFELNDAGPNDLLPSVGGALAFENTIVSLQDCAFAGNRAQEGGAIYLSGGSLTLTDVTFEGSTLYLPPGGGEQRGGAVLLESASLDVTGGEFVGYSGANKGGAVYVAGGSVSVDGTRLVTNQALADGGALYQVGGDLTLVDADFDGNTSGTFGGAVYASGGIADVRRTLFTGNQSSSLGGGLYLDASLAGSRVASTVFSQNTANIIAGGLLVNNGDTVLEHLLFHGNSGAIAAGAAQITGGQFTLRNSLFLDNSGGALSVATGGVNQLDFNRYWGTTGGVDVTGASLGANSAIEDPLLVNPVAGDFYLGAASPAIDAGDPASSVDFDGSPADIGPFAGSDDLGGRPAQIVDPQREFIGGDASLTWTLTGVGTVEAETRVYGAQYTVVGKAPLDPALLLLQVVTAPTSSWLHVGAVDFGYQLQAVDADGHAGSPTDLFGVVTAAPERPGTFALSRPRPNPFNPSTTLELELPQAGRVRAEIYDLAGRRVRVVVDRELPVGTHQLRWDARDQQSRSVASGVYVLRLSSDAGNATRRLLLVK